MAHAKLTASLLPVVLAGLLLVGSSPPPTADAAAFAQLSTLAGTWESAPSEGRVHTVDFRLIANGTVLVENWQLSPTRTSMTTYYLDNGRLNAVHYCPQGNIPHLRFVGETDGTMRFVFRDGINVATRGASHQHSIRLRVLPDGAFERSEYYVENGRRADSAAAEAEQVIAYHRIPNSVTDAP